MAAVQLIEPTRLVDDRGWFCEVISDAALAARGVRDRFVQDNHSLSRAAFTLRGLHFQAPPYAQAKLVRCVRGRSFDVAVDIRAGSPTFGRWVSAELSADTARQLYIPVGFAHGFLTLEPDTEILYKVSAPHAPAAAGSIRWDDPAIAIDWPLPTGIAPIVSARDIAALPLERLAAHLVYAGDPLPSILYQSDG